ncbi:MAG: class I SAM-dependent methyltransferase, partial [Candidatus Rokuibacteriota bacterium]
ALVLAVGLLGACGWLKRLSYEGSSRDAWQQPDRVVAALGIANGDRVADLGSGSGYFTVRLARAVGSGGKVYAVDVDEEMNEYLRQRLARESIANVEVVLGRFEDPLLPDGGIDLVVIIDTYHHIEDRPTYFRNLRRDLAPGGRVAVIDFDGRKGWFVRLFGHYTPREDLLREMREAGYEVSAEHDFIDRQSFVVFEPGAWAVTSTTTE